MKLIRVEFLQANYDPRTDKGPPYGGSVAMLASDGYTLDLTDGVVRIGHSGRTGVYPFAVCRYALEAPPEPPQPKPEALKLAEPQAKPQLEATRLVEPRDLPLVVQAKATTDADHAERRAERAAVEERARSYERPPVKPAPAPEPQPRPQPQQPPRVLGAAPKQPQQQPAPATRPRR